MISYYYKRLNKTFSFLASFNIHILYNKKKVALTLSTSFFPTFLSFNISELNNYIYNKFVLLAVKSKIIYLAAAEFKKT